MECRISQVWYGGVIQIFALTHFNADLLKSDAPKKPGAAYYVICMYNV